MYLLSQINRPPSTVAKRESTMPSNQIQLTTPSKPDSSKKFSMLVSQKLFIKTCRPALIIFGVMALLVSPLSWAEPIVTETINHYQVTGHSIDEVRQSLDDQSPVNINNRFFDASTERWVDWELRLGSTSSQGCQIIGITTHVEILYTLPELSITETTPDDLVQLWSNYYNALVRHEKGHGSIGILAARRIEEAIRRLPTANSCDELKLLADKLASQILTTYDYRDQRYDINTGHGELEGALFPPVQPL